MWAAPPAPLREAPPQPMSSNVARLSQKFGNVATVSVVPVASSTSSLSSSREPSRSRSPQLQMRRDDAEEEEEDSDYEEEENGMEYENELRSRSSTLAGEEEIDFDYPEKTPTPDSVAMRLIDFEPSTDEVRAYIEEFKEDFVPSSKGSIVQEEEPLSPVSVSVSVAPRHVPGPLEMQLQDLMSKIVFMERENPLVAVKPEEYSTLQSRLEALEAEQKTWQSRHEALFALRDEDVANIIKTRGLLAKARRDLEEMTKLRDEDLDNVQAVRSKLAEATRKLEKLESQPQLQSGRGTPTSSSTRGRPSSLLLERRDTTDLFAAAKAAALEQRTLELEKRNEDLVAQLNALKFSKSVIAEGDGTGNIETVNRIAAHKAWKETVADLNAKLKVKDDEMTRLKAAAATASTVPTSAAVNSPIAPLAPALGSYDWHRVEALHDEHASYRERVGGKMQRLRAEKEELQRELHRKEDECHVLEVKVQSLQRRLPVA